MNRIGIVDRNMLALESEAQRGQNGRCRHYVLDELVSPNGTISLVGSCSSAFRNRRKRSRNELGRSNHCWIVDWIDVIGKEKGGAAEQAGSR